MAIDLSGVWKCTLTKDPWEEQPLEKSEGLVSLPGCLQEAGLGYPITYATPWMSGLHNPFWQERKEYQYARKAGCKVPFLSQPPMHYMGLAWYERTVEIPYDAEWILYLEKTHWHSKVYLDEVLVGEDASLCTAHVIPCGFLKAGEHSIRIGIDNSLQEPYRPDGHEVTDALGATWNGIVGEIFLETCEERQERKLQKAAYAQAHPRDIQVKDGQFYVDGSPEYFRGTHFGGDYPLTGYPNMNPDWWLDMMRKIKEYGLNFIRFHSYCPPEVAFLAADQEGIYLQVECGMWNIFQSGSKMLDVLRRETRRILEQFGHHPSFVLFSSGNEPGGDWYEVLRDWVGETRETDKALGYEGRRLYTAQSGWFYDVPPSKVTGTDYLYFHRSAYGPYRGGTIRNHLGWKGKDYSPSIEGSSLPVISHELGQWCAYPDYEVIDQFTGYLRPGNYEIFRENAAHMGVLPHHKSFVYCSGRNQMRFYKEDLEATFRTKGIAGFELLDLHDYLGQGSALVGILDTFWQEKGYVTAEEFRESCGETILLTRLVKYNYRLDETMETSIEIVHFGQKPLEHPSLRWRIGAQESLLEGEITLPQIRPGSHIEVGKLNIPLMEFQQYFSKDQMGIALTLEMWVGEVRNHWNLTIYRNLAPENVPESVMYTKNAAEAKANLEQGRVVLFTPYLSELDYECPPLNMKNVFWNAQMGPDWIRSLGLVLQEDHPVWKSFPSAIDGGWQWEDILSQARGFCLTGLPEGLAVPVRAIDDWNRNLPLSLFLEAKVGKGRLLLVTANLDGTFEERPAAYTWKQALLQYAVTGDFIPTAECTWEQLSEHFFPLLRTRELLVEGKNSPLCDPDPNKAFRLEGDTFPMTIALPLQQEMCLQGLLYMPVQKDRMFQGCVKEFYVECLYGDTWQWVCGGILENSLFSQKIRFPRPITTTQLRFCIDSVYGDQAHYAWRETPEGWERFLQEPQPVAQIGALHLICEEAYIPSDEIFWDRNRRSATKEIDN